MEGRDKIETLRNSQDDSYLFANNLALIHAGLGDERAALGNVKHAVMRWRRNDPPYSGRRV